MSKAKNASVNVQANSNQYAFWLIAASIIAYLGVAPFFKALFNGGVRNNLSAYIFNQPIYAALIFTFLLSLCFGCFLLVRGQLALLRGTAIPLVLVWLLPVTYLITLWASAVSTSQTIHAIVIQCMYAFFFMFAIFLARSDKGSAVLATAIMGVGYVIVIFGFLNWFGTHIYRDAVTLEPGRLRLTSVFQYANAYAAFLIALLLASLYLLIRSHQRIVQIITAAMIVPTFLSLILTFSRGGLVMLPVIAFVLLFLLPFRHQLIFVIYSVVAGLISFLCTPFLSDIGLQQFEQPVAGRYLAGVAVVLGASLLFAGFAHVMNRYINPRLEAGLTRIDVKRASRYLIPVIGVACGCLLAFLLLETSAVKLLPESLQQRISNINLDQHSVLERATFYRDSMKIIRDYPVFGAGGSAWAQLYEHYQNNPYSTTQAHSYFIQHWIETGSVGLIVLLAFIAVVYWRYLRYHRIHGTDRNSNLSVVFFIFTIAILLHSLIDFDMSFVYIGSLVFLCLGVLTGVSGTAMASAASLTTNGWKRWLMPALVIGLSLVLLVTSVRFQTAANHYVEALGNSRQGQLDKIQTPLDRAIRQFQHADYLGYRARLMLEVYRQTGDEQYADEFLKTVDQLLKREPVNQVAWDARLQYYLHKNDWAEAANVLEAMLEQAPWNITLYDTMISVKLQLANESESSTRDAYMDQALGYYEEILARIEQLNHLPENQLPGKEFDVNPNIAHNIAQVYLLRGQYQQAADLLRPYATGSAASSELDISITRAYLATLILLGQPDEAMYQDFVGQHPEEGDQIDQLVIHFARD